MLTVITKALRENGVGAEILDQSSQAPIQRFKTNPNSTVLLLNLNTAASGLTLTEATHVFLAEPILNPAMELQAIGRVDRMGQTCPTHVWKYVVDETLEVDTAALAAAKMHHLTGTSKGLLSHHERDEWNWKDVFKLFKLNRSRHEGVDVTNGC